MQGLDCPDTMIPVSRQCVLLLFAVFLIASAGCITAWPSPNSTTVAPAGNMTTATSSPGNGATATVSPVPTFSDHGSLNVLRGEPFTITGTVPDRTITEVQVWFLNESISTILVPVMPDGTFSVTLDAGVTSALSRNFTSVIVAQYPSPPDHFAVNLDPVSWQITGSSVIPAGSSPKSTISSTIPQHRGISSDRPSNLPARTTRASSPSSTVLMPPSILTRYPRGPREP